MKKLIISVFVLLTATACVSNFTLVTIPNYKDDIRVYVSPDNISSFSEQVSGDHRVENSQVFLSGNEISGGKQGIIGGLIDRQANAVAMPDSNSTLSVKFVDIVKRILTESPFSVRSNIVVVDSPKYADILLLPFVRFSSKPGGMADATFTLKAEYKDRGTEEMHYKKYRISNEGYLINKNSDKYSHMLTGKDSWSDNQAALLKSKARAMFTILAQFMVNEANGNNYNTNNPETYRYTYLKKYLDKPGNEKGPKQVLWDENDSFNLVGFLYDGRISHSTSWVITKDYYVK